MSLLIGGVDIERASYFGLPASRPPLLFEPFFAASPSRILISEILTTSSSFLLVRCASRFTFLPKPRFIRSHLRKRRVASVSLRKAVRL